MNLESETKNITIKSLEEGPTPETFNLAQSKILQLMTKDSYRRFLQSKLYLDLLKSAPPSPTPPIKEMAPCQRVQSFSGAIQPSTSTNQSKPIFAKPAVPALPAKPTIPAPPVNTKPVAPIPIGTVNAVQATAPQLAPLERSEISEISPTGSLSSTTKGIPEKVTE